MFKIQNVIESKEKALHNAINKSQEDALNWLKQHPEFDINASLDASGRCALHLAISAGHQELVIYLLEERQASIEAIDNDGHTAWLWAISCGQWKIARVLLEKNCCIDVLNSQQCNAMHLALRHANSFEDWQMFLDLLIKEQQDKFLKALDNEGMTMLHYAARNASPAVIQWFCQNTIFAGKINAQSHFGHTPLSMAVRANRDENVIAVLLKNKANPCIANQNGVTALLFARQKGDLLLATRLIDNCLQSLNIGEEFATKLLQLNTILTQNEADFFENKIDKKQWLARLVQCEIEIFKILKPLEIFFLQPQKASAEQIIYMVWLLLELSEVLLNKVRLDPLLLSARGDALNHAATAIRLCEQTDSTIPEWLSQRCQAQSWRILNSFWIKEQKSDPPDFRQLSRWLQQQRQLLKEHRQKLYQIIKDAPFLSFEEHCKLKTTEIPTQQWLQQNCAFFINLTAEFFQQIQMLFPEMKIPCEYLLGGVGSMSKKEMSFFSDFENVFFVSNKEETTSQYFSLMGKWLARGLVLMCETENIFMLPKDSIILNLSGFCFDAKGGYGESRPDLLNTPLLMAYECSREGAELIARSALSSICSISGNERLLEEYQQALQQQFEMNTNKNFIFNRQPLYQKRALEQLKINCNDFNIHTSKDGNAEKVKKNLQQFNIKTELLRLPSQVISDLCMYYNLWPKSADTWSRLDILYENKKISQENYYRLRYLLAGVLQLRLKAHGFYGYEHDYLYHPSHKNDDAPFERLELDEQTKNLIIEFYSILIPLHEFATEFYQSNGKENLLAKQSCYEIDTKWTKPEAYERKPVKNAQPNKRKPWTKAQANERLGNINEAAILYAQALQINPDKLELRCHYVNFLQCWQQQLYALQQYSPQKQETREQQNHQQYLDQQIQYLADTLAGTTKSSKAYLDVYTQLVRPAQLKLVAKLVTLSQENQREFLLPIVKLLMTKHHEQDKSEAWKNQQKQWQAQLQLIVERVSSKETYNRIKVISVLFPAHENWVLKKEIAEKLFTEKGEFKEQEYQGNHKVFRLQEQELDVFLKLWPGMPGTTYLVEQLYQLIFNRGSCLNEFIQLVLPNGESLPVSVSQTIQGETLESVLKNQKELIDEIDMESFAELFIMSLLTKPEDGLPSNFILRKNERGQYDIVDIDFDHNFFEEWAWKEIEEPNQEKKLKLVLQLKTILWCLKSLMQKKIPLVVIERFVRHDPKAVIDTWLREAQIQNNYYQQFGEKLINSWHKTRNEMYNGKLLTGSTTLAIPIKKGDITELYERWLLIREALVAILDQQENEKIDDSPIDITCDELLRRFFPRAWRAYQETQDEPIECLRQLGNYPCNEKGDLVSQSHAFERFILSSILHKNTDIKLTDLQPEQGRLELELLYVQSQQLSIIQKALMQGNVSEFKKLLSAEHKQLVLFGNGKPTWEPLDWKNLKPQTLKALLNAIEEQPFTRIDLRHCAAIPIEVLLKIIENSPDLQQLRLGDYPQLTQHHLTRILELCPCLTELTLIDMPALNGKTKIAIKNLSLLHLEKTNITEIALDTPMLKYLYCRQNSALTRIQNIYTDIRSIDVSYCENLRRIECNDFTTCISLTKFKTTGTEKLRHFKALEQFPAWLQFLGTEQEKYIPAQAHKLSCYQSKKLLSRYLGKQATLVQSLLEFLNKQHFASVSNTDIQQCLQILKNTEERSTVRNDAIEKLLTLEANTAQVIQALNQALKDKDSYIRAVAAIALGRFGIKTKQVIQALLEAVNATKYLYKVRVDAVTVLGELGIKTEQSVKELLEIVNDKDDEVNVRIAAITTLGVLGDNTDPVIQAILQTLNDKNPDIREAAAKTLDVLGVNTDPVIQALLIALNDKQANVRAAAATALGVLGVKTDPVIQALLIALNDKQANVRAAAATALGKLGVNTDPVIQALLIALNDKQANVRVAAATALGVLGVNTEQVIQALLIALNDKQANVRAAAATALGKLIIKSEQVIKALLQTLNDKDKDIGAAAAVALAALDVDTKHIINALWEIIFNTSDTGLCWSALKALVDVKQLPISLFNAINLENQLAAKQPPLQQAINNFVEIMLTSKALLHLFTQLMKNIPLENNKTLSIGLKAIIRSLLGINITRMNCANLAHHCEQFLQFLQTLQKIHPSQPLTTNVEKKPNIFSLPFSTLSNKPNMLFFHSKKPVKQTKNTMFTGKLQHDNEQKEFIFELQTVAGKGDCAVLASPFKDRKEIANLLWIAIQQPENCIKLQDEVFEALHANEQFLLEEDQQTWENFRIHQEPYHIANSIFQEKIKQIKEILQEKSTFTDDQDLLSFLESNNEYASQHQELLQLQLACEEQKHLFDKIETECRQFCSTLSVCQSYIKIIVAKEKQWIGKGSLFLAAQQKGINLCLWQEQKDSELLLLDENYSYLNNSSLEFNHVVYRLGATHYDLLIETLSKLTNVINYK